ncbi:dynamin family protein [Nocardia asteroides]|uniref:dynamin family protein n=1 Tax=Nocardia asteroides TaxID=1824 RepID=UPI001E2C29EE|nr:dynamin family protein [Nocardia asteroides]UGT60490.1 dynamin family protein [Nocardia asteroides]
MAGNIAAPVGIATIESEETGLSAVAGLEAATAKNPEVMAPLIRILEDLRETARFAGREDLNGRIGMALAKLSDPRVRLVVVGRPRSGMSTVVNSLIGAPVSVTEGNGVPVIVEYGLESAATLVKSTAPGRTERTPIDPRAAGAALAATDGVVRIEYTEPSPFLADGIVLMDAPGSTGDDHISWSMIAAADAVLYVTDAGAEFDAEQLERLDRIHRVCPTVICVLTKIDQYPHWSNVQQRNRDLLDSAGLGLAVAPISAQLHLDAVADGDYHRDIESGLPQLVDHLRDFVVARADVVARDAAIGDIRLIAGHLEGSLRTEQETLRDPRRRAEITRRLSLARDEADQLRQRTANWQVTLVDGSTELMADIEHDLRHRLRSLVRDAEAEITESDPATRWKEFAADLDARICEAVEENFVVAHYRSVELCEQVAGRFPAHHRMPPLPDLRLANPGEVLEEVAPLEPLESGKPGVTQQFLSALRGSYGGILMVGLATSLLGMSLVNWYSAGAGVLLGVNALWDDRKARKQRRRAEAKVAVSRLMDDVVFQVGKESRNRLRAVQRALRDHFTELATEVLRGADEVLRVASEADGRYGHRRAERLAELERHLDELRGVRGRAEALTPF